MSKEKLPEAAPAAPKKALPQALGLLLALLAVVGAGCCFGLLSLYFSAGDHGLHLFAFYLTQPMVLVLNLLPFVLLGLLCFALCNRVWLAMVLDGAVCLVFSWAQYWKLMARSDPIYAEDLTIFTEATQMAGQYIQITWQIILSALLTVLCIAVLFRFFGGKFQKPLGRILLAALVVALGFWLYPNYYTNNAVYNSMTVWPKVNPWFETNRYISRGGIYPFIHSIPDAIPTPPEGYDALEAEALLAASPSDDIPDDRKVSIIVTQLEAFADFSTLTDKITAADPYADYHAILSESYHGTLVPNVFAGGTIDTERCVLTGFSSLEHFRRPSWSYARYFEGQGYTVQGAHAGYEAFYNRLNVNANLGIPNYRFIENYYNQLTPYIPMDELFLADVAEQALTAMEQGPVFSFNVTYQNHGPYDTATAWFDEIYVPQGDLSSGDFHVINNYLDGVADTGKQMQTMLDTFRASDKPVLLVFFGDHKPWLGEQSVTYAALGIDIKSPDDASFYNYYATDYLIWANDAAKTALGNDFVGVGPTISPCFLMNVLFDQCGWEGPGFRKLTDAVMEQVPVLHTTKRYLSGGSLTDTLTEAQADLLRQMAYAQYHLAQDAGGSHP